MGKIREGDLVKTITAHKELWLSKRELGKVLDVGTKDAEGDYVMVVAFAANTEDFDYEVHMMSTDVRKVGTKLKKKMAAELVVGDQIVLEGDLNDEVLHAEVYKIKEIEHNYVKDIVTLRGKGFEVELTPVELTYKVPVVI